MRISARFATLSLVTALAFTAGRAHAEDVQVSDSARQHFKTGVAYLTDPDGARYEDAYREFKTAYADSPSWKILGNLGITAMKLERDGEAVDAFEKYLAGGGNQIDPSERAQMERDLMTTKAGLVWVSIQVDPPNANVTDDRQPVTGRPITNRYDLDPSGKLRIGIRRGNHKITARLDGYSDQSWEFDAEPGAEQTHEFKLEKPKPGPAAPGGATEMEGAKSRPIGTPVIIGAAATGALLIGSGVVGLMALSKNSQFKDKNDGLHVAEAQSLHDSGQTLNIVGDVLLGGAVAAGVVTAILFVNRPEVASGSEPGRDTGRLRLTPAVGTTGGGLFMTGRF